MKRSEISDEYKWSVKDLYSSDELWNNDYEKALKSTQEKSSFAPNGNAYSGWLRSVRISVGVPASGPGVKWRAS